MQVNLSLEKLQELMGAVKVAQNYAIRQSDYNAIAKYQELEDMLREFIEAAE